MRLLLILILITTLNFFGYSAYGQEDIFIERQDRVWLKTQAFGAIAPNYQYMLELQTRYNDSRTKLNVTIVRPAIVYKYTENISLWLGYAFFADLPEREIDFTEYEHRIWQQIFMPITKKESYEIFSRTRLEQRENPIDPQWAWRLRQKYDINLLKLSPSPKIMPYLSDELLINFNNPAWVGQRLIDQNRFYAGIQIPLNNATIVDLRYLYQVEFGIPVNQSNHIFYFKLTLNLDSSPYLRRN